MASKATNSKSGHLTWVAHWLSPSRKAAVIAVAAHAALTLFNPSLPVHLALIAALHTAVHLLS